jgi:hypothetical protein
MANEAEPGRVECIHFAISEGEPMLATARIRVLAGIGLEGDRYATGRGRFSGTPGTGRALTLIEAEVLESLARAWESRCGLARRAAMSLPAASR